MHLHRPPRLSTNAKSTSIVNSLLSAAKSANVIMLVVERVGEQALV